ncbi:methyltransferase domain-containing protein [Micromonospora sp. M12]
MAGVSGGWPAGPPRSVHLGYARLVADRMAHADAALDVDTGGGEVLAEVPRPPKLLTATEGWPPNVEVARRTLRRVGATVVAVAPDRPLPFRDASFDLVVSRHPVRTDWRRRRGCCGRAGRTCPSRSGRAPCGS